MFAVLRRNPVALVLAILLHIGLAVFLILEVDWRDEVKPIGADVVVVQAELVDENRLNAEVEKRNAAERAEQEKLAELEKRRAEEKRKLAELEQQRKQRQEEQARKQAEEQQRIEAEKVRLAEIKRKQEQAKQKQAEEKRRLAELEQKRKLEQQKREQEEQARQKAEAEAKKQAEAERQERIAREKAEAERKRKAAAEAKARADRQAREAELAAQFAAEQDASELQQVSALIQQKIERNWLRPPGTEGLKCTLRVRLGTSGSVLVASVVKSSGNVAFDRSVEAAVRKADPLPMPKSPRLLAQFRELNFEFVPSN